MSKFPRRYSGLRWSILYGNYEGPEQVAVEELQRFVQHYQPYVIECCPAVHPSEGEPEHRIIVGTPQNNPLLETLIRNGQLTAPAGREGFAYALLHGKEEKAPRTIAIAGFDHKGVLNGTVDFCARASIQPSLITTTLVDQRAGFEGLPPFSASGKPTLEHRGIWTWGYVIYDYRRFLDNMARLKMNMLVVWFDEPPINAREIIAYAHQRGIQVIAGFHWGWGLKGISLFKPNDRHKVKEQVINNYERKYLPMGFDGIYFQTITEHNTLSEGGRTVASAACDWVNDIGRALLARHPHLQIQFGLHATSILNNYTDLATLDDRIQIIWEDAGVTPYTYTPVLESSPDSHQVKAGIGTFESTLHYSTKLASFRPHTGFGLCPKGWSNLDWNIDFENHNSFILGQRDPTWCENRLRMKNAWWDMINRQWIPCYQPAAEFYRAIRHTCTGPITCVGLVEDGLFEMKIQPSVALFSEMMWNPYRADSEMLDLGYSPYYQTMN